VNLLLTAFFFAIASGAGADVDPSSFATTTEEVGTAELLGAVERSASADAARYALPATDA